MLLIANYDIGFSIVVKISDRHWSRPVSTGIECGRRQENRQAYGPRASIPAVTWATQIIPTAK